MPSSKPKTKKPPTRKLVSKKPPKAKATQASSKTVPRRVPVSKSVAKRLAAQQPSLNMQAAAEAVGSQTLKELAPVLDASATPTTPSVQTTETQVRVRHSIKTRAEISLAEQGSEDWYRERLGVLTASRMHRVINGTQKGWVTFMGELYREINSPEKVLAEEPVYVEDMEHGKAYEDAARASAELLLEMDIIPVGFAHRFFDHMKIGASADGLILNPDKTIYATVEIKVFTKLEHHAYVWTNKRILDRYVPQVQTQNLVFEAPRSIFVSHHEDMPDPRARTAIVEVAPDLHYHQALLGRANSFYDQFRMFKANGGSLGVVAHNTIPQRF